MVTKKRTLILWFMILGLFFICSCEREKIEKLVYTPESYPVIDGSTVTIPLSEALAAKLMNIPIVEARQYVVHNTTHEAYINVIEGKADLIFVTSPSQDEIELAKNMKVKLELIPIVSEAFVFLNS